MGDEFKENLGSLMQDFQKMQKDMLANQGKLVALEVNGEAGGGLVKVRMNGGNRLLKTNIDPQLLTSQPQGVVEELITAAVNDAANKVEKERAGMMTQLASDYQLPTDLLNFMDDKEDD